MILKPLIMASLMGLYISKASPQHPGFLLAMVFALFGDIFLLFEGDLFFKLGLACFLVMQLFYIAYFNRNRTGITQIKMVIILGVLLTCVLFLFYAFDRLGENRIYVIAYSIALSTMAVFAILRSSRFIFGPLALGACLFVISDLALAWNKFIKAFEGAGILILLTYALAQFLILNGVIFDESKK